MMDQPHVMKSRPPPENPVIFQISKRPVFTAPGRNNWKGKKSDSRRQDPLGVGNYKPPSLNDLQFQNRAKARWFCPRKKHNNRFAPLAPRNTTSYIIRAKKSGGIASAVTPATLPSPMFSPSREVVVDMAKEEWGVNGYGSMKGLIRLRCPGQGAGEEGGSSSDSDVEEHVEVERRLDHDLSRFEMIYPSAGDEQNSVLENRMDDQEVHIVQLEEENLSLKERLFLMERELEDLRRRVLFLETGPMRELESDNDVDGGGGGQVSSERSVWV